MPNDNNQPAIIDYYSDVLCVWARIAQPRLEELQQQWSTQISIRHRYVDIFGDSHSKVSRQWGADTGFEKFRAHVASAVTPFDKMAIHTACWSTTRPRSSMQAHLLLKAAALIAGEHAVDKLALRIRKAFFVQGLDIGDQSILLTLAENEKLDTAQIENTLRDGSAMAALSSDLRSASELGVKGSPTWVLNAGRQILYGNVGYRILNANIEELLKHPGSEASWC